MDLRTNRGRRRFNGRAALFAVMLVFCILALIEIAFGQKKLREQKEQLALEEDADYQTLQASERAQENIPLNVRETQDNVFMNVVDKNTEKPDKPQEIGTPKQDDGEEETNEYDMQIVFMGDSLMDFAREDDGIALLVGEACNARVYNMSMGGTTAALAPGYPYDLEKWDSRCLLGVVNAILGHIDGSILEGYRAGEILKECDFSRTDYFVIEYGVNDFLAQIPISMYMEDGQERDVDDVHTYAGALETAIMLLHDSFPDAKIIVISPHYCQFFSGETFIGDGYSVDYGYGPLVSYARVCGNIAKRHKEDGVLFYNAFEDSGVDAYTADEYTEDGIHLSSAGRRAYVKYIISLIQEDFYPEE